MNIDVERRARATSAHQQIPPVQALGQRLRGGALSQSLDRVEETRAVAHRRRASTVRRSRTRPRRRPARRRRVDLGQVVAVRDAGPFVVAEPGRHAPVLHVRAHDRLQDSLQPTGDCRGDPEFVERRPARAVPRRRTRSSPIRRTPRRTSSSPARRTAGLRDVNLDCVGTLTGWQRSTADATSTRASTSRSSGTSVGKCNNGLHTITSAQPFGLTVWAWDQYVSYAYPAGASVQPINSVIVPAVPH